MELLLQSHIFKFPASKGVLVALAGAIVVSGCNAGSTLNPRQTMNQGYVMDQETLDMVPVGSSREQVILALGTPSTSATFDSEAFYYISQKRVRNVAFMNPRLVDQRVLAVYFGEDDRVINIANYGMQDGKVFDFISRTTPTGGADQNFLQQVLSGVIGFGGNPFGR
jgi:outer membrane protein assembly factor BamE (lipoprotein component of BamABCDE complex)